MHKLFYALVIATSITTISFTNTAEAWWWKHERPPRPTVEQRLCKQVAWLFARFPTPPPLPAVCTGSQPTPPTEEPPSEEPEPEPTINHVLISEVYYDPDSTHGTEPAHEWVEIYNPTDQPVVLEGWSLGDTSGTDVLPTTELPAKTFALIVATSTIAQFWGIPESTVMIVIGNSIGNGLGNTGDALALKDANNNSVDALSWGTDTNVFATPVADVAEGHSLARASLSVDSDSAADWTDREVPTLGN